MRTNFLQAIAALALVLSMAACASLPEGQYERLAQIKPGYTKAEVLRTAGRPWFSTRTRLNGEVWVYSMPNAWDGRTEYDIKFDANGVVTEKVALGYSG